MADEIDQAQEQIEQQLHFAFMTRQRDNLRPIGACWFCHEELTETMLFCSSDCRDDWDKRKRAKERAGTKYR